MKRMTPSSKLSESRRAANAEGERESRAGAAEGEACLLFAEL